MELLPFEPRFLGTGYILSSCLVLMIVLTYPLAPQCSSSMGVHWMSCTVGLVAVLVVVVVLLGFFGKRVRAGSFIEMGWLALSSSLAH